MNKNMLIAYLGLVGVISTTALVLSLHSKKPEIGMIDVNLIIAEQAKALAQTDSKASSQKIRAAGDQLKENVMAWAQDQNLTILAKGAVWSRDIPDYTEDVMVALKMGRGQP